MPIKSNQELVKALQSATVYSQSEDDDFTTPLDKRVPKTKANPEITQYLQTANLQDLQTFIAQSNAPMQYVDLLTYAEQHAKDAFKTMRDNIITTLNSNPQAIVAMFSKLPDEFDATYRVDPKNLFSEIIKVINRENKEDFLHRFNRSLTFYLNSTGAKPDASKTITGILELAAALPAPLRRELITTVLEADLPDEFRANMVAKLGPEDFKVQMLQSLEFKTGARKFADAVYAGGNMQRTNEYITLASSEISKDKEGKIPTDVKEFIKQEKNVIDALTLLNTLTTDAQAQITKLEGKSLKESPNKELKIQNLRDILKTFEPYLESPRDMNAFAETVTQIKALQVKTEGIAKSGFASKMFKTESGTTAIFSKFIKGADAILKNADVKPKQGVANR